ncbi:MAG: hypothetical protein RQ760_14600 [Sedimentisphaerales bacterium]|nr:hypothetical protein [Sedimentisphaerales bacterium]
MADAAHAELLEHEVYQKPFKVEPEFEMKKTPSNYHGRNLSEDKLPDEMKVWNVQNSGKRYGSVVARAYGFTDSPDAEVLAKGFNTGKEYGAVGVGRHGNFLQWGYSSSPSKMTDAGRKFFINCICYISKFDGKAPLVRRASSDRLNAMRLAAIITRISGDKKEFFMRLFPAEFWEKYGTDPDGLVKYYRENIEFVYWDKKYLIDSEIKSLGLDSNRSLDNLERLIGFLQDETKADTAKLLLARYTYLFFQNAQGWKQWFENNRKRIYFSDVGGYKFLVVPEGYLD